MNTPRDRRRLDRITIVLTLLVVALLLMPMRESASLQWLFNAAHVPGFALLAILWAEDLLSRGWSKPRRFWMVAVIGLLLAAATEGLQAFVPGRFANLDDVLRNALGIALGLAAHACWPGVLAKRLAVARK